jgi:hypothetical protein
MGNTQPASDGGTAATPLDLRALARIIMATSPPPRGSMRPDEYLLASMVQTLGNGLNTLADQTEGTQ